MTSPAAATAYLAGHLIEWAGKGYAVYNPHGKPLQELPVIYGFNNGGEPGWYQGALLAQDGAWLGGHVCSHEGYMPHDLGVLEGSRDDRHESFREHYPDGYRMDFVPGPDVRSHAGLAEAYRLNQERRKAREAVANAEPVSP